MEVPRTLRAMGARAFSGCERLGTIYVEDGCGCYLSRANVPVSARIVFPQETAVSGVPLSRLRELKKVVVPDGAERVGSYWFWASHVESVEIPASVAEVGVEAFCNCARLKRLVFGTGRPVRGAEASTRSASRLKTICANAFHRCVSLTGVRLPDGLEEIGLYAFSQSGLESLAVPSSVRTIRQGAFCQCLGLRKVALGEGLETLGTGELTEGGEQWQGVFEGSGLEKVRLPETLKRIEYGAFRDCRNLKGVQFPSTLEEIGLRAFEGSGFESVTTPLAVRIIHQSAFCRCQNLKRVVLNEGLEVLGINEYHDDT